MPRRSPPKGDEQLDLFVAVFTDIPIRDQRDMMERPFFSLSKTPRLKPIEYRVGDTWVEVSPEPEVWNGYDLGCGCFDLGGHPTHGST